MNRFDGDPDPRPVGRTVRATTVTIPAAGLGPEGLPLLRRGHEPDLSDADRALLGRHPDHELAARPTSLLPYRAQNHYDRDVTDRSFAAVELANEHLRAVFLPEFGGRLWSLVDLASGRDLFFQPDAIWYGNLALRDAWASGGIEWNLGTTGHWGLTCDPVAAGIVDVDGEQVLRMWAFERLTGLVWRLEAWLPQGSRHLFTSARIANHRDVDVAFYWWSNSAVDLTGSSRVLAPTSEAFHHEYDGRLSKLPFPVADDVDGSRPDSVPRSADYFFESVGADGLPATHPWVARVDDEGPGTLLVSTRELSGKKLFVWGNTRGGHKWQSWLNGEGRYLELQSGFTRTQREHARLAPGDEVSWVEAFGPVTGDVPEGYDEAVAHVAAQLPVAHMAQARALFDAARHLEPRVLQPADGWGRVEVEAGHLAADPAVPFDADLTAAQAAWVALARTGIADPVLGRSPLVGPEWAARIAAAEPSPTRDLLLGYCAWADGDHEGATALWEAAAAAEPSAMALHCLAVARDDKSSVDLARRAHEADPDDDDLLVEHLVRSGHQPHVVLDVVDSLTPERRGLPRVRLAEARALVDVGRHEEARTILDRLELPNLRETSDELKDLWEAWCAAAGVSEPLPPHLDFQMY